MIAILKVFPFHLVHAGSSYYNDDLNEFKTGHNRKPIRSNILTGYDGVSNVSDKKICTDWSTASGM